MLFGIKGLTTEHIFFCCWYDDGGGGGGGWVIIIYLIFESGKGAVFQQINQKTAVWCMDSQMNCVAD